MHLTACLTCMRATSTGLLQTPNYTPASYCSSPLGCFVFFLFLSPGLFFLSKSCNQLLVPSNFSLLLRVTARRWMARGLQCETRSGYERAQIILYPHSAVYLWTIMYLYTYLSVVCHSTTSPPTIHKSAHLPTECNWQEFLLLQSSVNTAETSINFYQTAHRNIPEDNHLH
jgi:hypothetical protein